MAEHDIDGCHYIIGELKSDEPWHYCGRLRRQGSSYCDHHHTICYHRLRRRVRIERGEITTAYLTDILDDAA